VPDERLLGFLRELEQADAEVAATLAELDELAGEVEEVRARALTLDRQLARLPAARERLEAAAAAADRAVAARRAELEAAERLEAEAREGGEDRGRATARHAVVRAADALGMAERAAAGARGELDRTLREAEAAQAETPVLLARAERLAHQLGSRPRLAAEAGASPPGDLSGLGEWASAARAALFVARGSLASERDAVIRQANELGALVLGETITASSTADVARRIERSG
jgi:small-conductance mechanosensitive channel